MLAIAPRRAVLAAAVAAAAACTSYGRCAIALEPPAVQYIANGSMPRKEELATLSVALEELAVALEVRLSGASSCAEARQELRAPIFSFLGYPGAPTASPLLASIPKPRRSKATTVLAEMLRDLEAVDAACGASAVDVDSVSVRERLEGARNRLRELIALYYGEACIGSPCNGRNGLPVGSAM